MLTLEQKKKIEEMLTQKASQKEIAEKLSISPVTVNRYVKSLEKKRKEQSKTEERKQGEQQEQEPEPKISEETRKTINENVEKTDWDRLADLIAKMESGQVLTSKELYFFVEFVRKHFFTQDIVAQKMIKEGIEKASEKSVMTKFNDIIDDVFSLAMEMHYLKMQYEPFCKEHDIDFKLLVR
ncbi:winged helix-turn-helix transcriptional regulator, partial [Caldisericum sp.]|uniref:winged helix-turn-helix transcriptional regulator n=1 Tax=Caldisericum sp. TaxID=2499687 RepID=UPI003D0EA5AE